MAKAIKVTFDAGVFFNAGVSAYVQDSAEAIILTCGEKNVKHALAAYVEGYVSKGLAKGGEITPAHRKLALALMDGVNPNAKTVPAGKVKRTPEQHALVRAGARRFNRVRAKLNVPAANTSGGARERQPKEKQVLKNPKVASAADAISHVRNMAMMLSTFCSKNHDAVGADLSALVADFVGKVNKLAK